MSVYAAHLGTQQGPAPESGSGSGRLILILITAASSYQPAPSPSAGSNSCLTDISAVIPKVFYISLSSSAKKGVEEEFAAAEGVGMPPLPIVGMPQAAGVAFRFTTQPLI